jgi:beta-lactamase regulating signal transducer with metallopeptidase domain
MPITFFNNAYFLQAIGWAIANSFWQSGLLWLIYKAVTVSNQKLPALVKYHLSLALLSLSFSWFVFTIVTNYQLLLHANMPFNQSWWFVKFQQLNIAFPFLAVIYFAALAIYTIQFFHHYYRLRSVSTRGLLKAPLDIRIFINNTSLHLGIKKKVQVWLSAQVDVPSVTGFFKPIVLLPAAIINHLSIEQVNAILLHELAHIKRNDYLVNFLQSIMVLILFFNPFAVSLNNTAKKEREYCCDDWVLNHQFNQLEYAKALLVLEEQRHQKLVLALAATNGKKILLQRIKRLLTTQTPETSTSFLQKFQLIGLCLFLFTGICVLIPILINYSSYKQNTVDVINKSLSIPAQPILANAAEINENPASITLKKRPAQLPSKKTRNLKTHEQNKPGATKTANEFTLAMVNEDEFLQKNQPAEIVASTISNKEKDSLQSIYVKIEEEQSGKKQVNTYYLKLKDDNGKTDIKPLLIIKKYKITPQKDSTAKLPGTKINAGKKRIST